MGVLVVSSIICLSPIYPYPRHRFRFFLVFRLEMVFEPQVGFGDEGLGADDARVREIACPVLKPAHFIHVEIMGALFFQNFLIDHGGAAFPRMRHGAGLIHIPAISPQPLLFIHHAEFDHAEIKGKKVVLIILLEMVPEGIPPVFLRPGNYAGANWIQIDIGQAVDERVAVFNDAAFKPFAPEGAAGIMRIRM